MVTLSLKNSSSTPTSTASFTPTSSSATSSQAPLLIHSASKVNTGVFGGVVAAALIIGFLIGVTLGILYRSSQARKSRNRHQNTVARHIEALDYTFKAPSDGENYSASSSPKVEAPLHGLDGIFDSLSEQEAVQKLDAISAGIMQVTSALAVKVSNHGTIGHQIPQTLFRSKNPIIFSNDTLERSAAFEVLASELISNVFMSHICDPVEYFNITKETSAFVSSTQVCLEQAYDLRMANQWKSMIYKAHRHQKKDVVGQQVLSEIQRELCGLLLWCGMESDQEAAIQLVSSYHKAIRTAAAKLIKLHGDIQEQMVSARHDIVFESDLNKLVIARLSNDGVSKILS